MMYALPYIELDQQSLVPMNTAQTDSLDLWLPLILTPLLCISSHIKQFPLKVAWQSKMPLVSLSPPSPQGLPYLQLLPTSTGSPFQS